MGWPDPVRFEDVANAGFRWGAVTGAAILLVAGLVALLGVAVYAVFTLDHIALLSIAIALPFLMIAGVFALAFGAFFGGLFGLVDYALVRLSESVLDGMSPSEAGARE